MRSHARSLGAAQIQIWPSHFILKPLTNGQVVKCKKTEHHSQKSPGEGKRKTIQEKEIAVNRIEVNSSPAQPGPPVQYSVYTTAETH